MTLKTNYNEVFGFFFLVVESQDNLDNINVKILKNNYFKVLKI
jgi:hypothetical protein